MTTFFNWIQRLGRKYADYFNDIRIVFLDGICAIGMSAVHEVTFEFSVDMRLLVLRSLRDQMIWQVDKGRFVLRRGLYVMNSWIGVGFLEF